MMWLGVVEFHRLEVIDDVMLLDFEVPDDVASFTTTFADAANY